MANIVTRVVKIDKILPHSGADKLYIAEIGGWQSVIRKIDDHPEFTLDEKLIYITPDSVLPNELVEKLGIENYVSSKVDKDGKRVQVVKKIKLRGEPSYGLIVKLPEDQDWEVGTDVKDYFNITKYYPPIKFSIGDIMREEGMFHKYIDIENLRDYSFILSNNDDIIITEKIHGTNCRIGYVKGELMAGSKGYRRKSPADINSNADDLTTFSRSMYWMPYSIEGVKKFLDDNKNKFQQVILYGEVFGSSVQKFDYGSPKGKLNFIAFDIMIDGKYLNYDHFVAICDQYNIPRVPELYKGKFDMELVKEYSKGNSQLGGTHIREGVVVKLAKEANNPKIGRIILKYISDDYSTNEKLTKNDFTDI